MRKVLIIILVFLSVISIILQFGSRGLGQILGVKVRAGVRIESNPKTKVFIEGKEVGFTPFQDENLEAKEYFVTLKPDSEGTGSAKVGWEGYAKLNQGTLTVINRELSEDASASSGEIITLEAGRGVTIVSTPTASEVTVDGEVKGRTPLSLPDLSIGEHQFIISHENYLKRSIRATVVEGFNLNLAVDLAIAEADLTKLPVVPTTETKEVVVRQTPTGFLRVRASASVNAAEVGRVNPGETLVLLEEIPNWNRVRLKDGKEGWVSSAYTERK